MKLDFEDLLLLATRVVCVDGFSISIQAGKWSYSSPKNNVGPWDTFELGFPSDVEDILLPYIEGGLEGLTKHPKKSVYPYVPKRIVLQLLESHGGPSPYYRILCPMSLHKYQILSAIYR